MTDRLDYIFPWTVAAFLAVTGIAHLIGEGDVLMLVGAIGWHTSGGSSTANTRTGAHDDHEPYRPTRPVVGER